MDEETRRIIFTLSVLLSMMFLIGWIFLGFKMVMIPVLSLFIVSILVLGLDKLYYLLFAKSQKDGGKKK